MSYQLTVGAGVNRRPSMLCLTLAISVHTLGSPYTQPSLGLEQIRKKKRWRVDLPPPNLENT